MAWWAVPAAIAATAVAKAIFSGEEEEATPQLMNEPTQDLGSVQPELLPQQELIDISQPIPQQQISAPAQAGFYGDIRSPFGDPYAQQAPGPAPGGFYGNIMSPFGDPYAANPSQQNQMSQQDKMRWINAAGSFGNTLGQGLSSLF